MGCDTRIGGSVSSLELCSSCSDTESLELKADNVAILVLGFGLGNRILRGNLVFG